MKQSHHTREQDVHHLMRFDSARTGGKYQIPFLLQETYVPDHLIDFCTALHSNDYAAGVHFFLADYRFERIWKEPQRYISILKRFSCVLTPDFSLYLDMPLAMKIWNTYRAYLLGQVMQDAGIRVIPSVSWAEPATYEFCFDGLEPGGVVSISTVGAMLTPEARKLFQLGFRTMMEHLNPEQIIVYGKCFDFIKNCQAKIHCFANTSFAWKIGNRNVSYKETV